MKFRLNLAENHKNLKKRDFLKNLNFCEFFEKISKKLCFFGFTYTNLRFFIFTFFSSSLPKLTFLGFLRKKLSFFSLFLLFTEILWFFYFYIYKLWVWKITFPDKKIWVFLVFFDILMKNLYFLWLFFQFVTFFTFFTFAYQKLTFLLVKLAKKLIYFL